MSFAFYYAYRNRNTAHMHSSDGILNMLLLIVGNKQKLTTWNVLRHSTFVYIRGALVFFSFFDTATTVALSSHASYNLIAIVKFIDHLCAKSNVLSRSTCLICLQTTCRCPQWPSSDWWSRRNDRGRIICSAPFWFEKQHGGEPVAYVSAVVWKNWILCAVRSVWFKLHALFDWRKSKLKIWSMYSVQ